MTETSSNLILETSNGVFITSLDELRAYLHEQTGVSVAQDDPVMIQHSMHGLFLADYDRLLDRHNKAITVVISAAVEDLTKEAISENLKEQVRLADRTHQEFERQYKRAKFLSIINLMVFATCLLVFVYLISQ